MVFKVAIILRNFILFSENFLKTSNIVILEFNILKISWSANSALTKSSIKEGIEGNKKES